MLVFLRRRSLPVRVLGGVLAAAAVLAAVTGAAALPGAVPRAGPASAVEAPAADADGWAWPVSPFRLGRPFVAPPHRYGPGHRGMDLIALDGLAVKSPADGTVAFAGAVAGRGILTIDHGRGFVSTLEPLSSELVQGTRVARGDTVGSIALGGHAAHGSLHFGVRLHGEYINPMLLLGIVPRAVLLPCC
jgi:murein DD-endopeptidase MepM/ murein hydrolase activator NlpD